MEMCRSLAEIHTLVQRWLALPGPTLLARPAQLLQAYSLCRTYMFYVAIGWTPRAARRLSLVISNYYHLKLY
jgi:hypothetical protein